MRLYMELARAILRELEASDEADGSTALEISIEGWSEKAISYHVAQLAEAGLVIAREIRGSWCPTRLTWNGHESLEGMRRYRRSLDRRRSEPAVLQIIRDEATGQSRREIEGG